MTTLDHYFWNSVDEKTSLRFFKTRQIAFDRALLQGSKISRPLIRDT